MTPSIDLKALRQTRLSETLVRFAFGGAMTAATGFIAQGFGPVVGGLFLAFPAVLPATLTLVARHSGRSKAVEEAGGAILGAVALGAFAAIGWFIAARAAAWTTILAAATVWIVTASALWVVASGWVHTTPGSSGRSETTKTRPTHAVSGSGRARRC